MKSGVSNRGTRGTLRKVYMPKQFFNLGEQTFIIRLLPSGNCWRNGRVSSKSLCISTDIYRWSIRFHQPFNVIIIARSLQLPQPRQLLFWCSRCAWGWSSRRTHASSVSEEGLLSSGILWYVCWISARDSQVMTDFICSFWLRMQTLKTHDIDCNTTTSQWDRHTWNYNDYLIWMDCGTLLNPLKGHGSSVKTWIIQKKHLEKNNTFVWSTRLPVSLMIFYVWLLRIPTKVVASIFKVKHFNAFGKASSGHA